MAAPAGNPNSTTPFFGCKISLISKSEIRYEGILYTIDPKESTIALAKVRSFGSEDRPVERPVPPRDDIFEFIIFRASDIKDLIVDDPPPAPALTDPAIIQAQTASTSFPSSFPQSSISANAPSAGHVAAAPQAVPQPQQTALQQLQQQQQQQAQKGPGAAPKAAPSAGDSQTDSAAKLSKPSASSNATPFGSGQAFAKVAAGGSTAAAAAGQAQQKQPRQQNMQFNKQPGQNRSEGSGPQQSAIASGLRGSANQQQQNQSQNQGQNGYVPRQQRQNNNQPQNRVIGENANPNFRNGPGGQQQQQGFRSYNANRFQPRQQQQMGAGPGGFRRGGFAGNTGGMHQQHRNFISHHRGPMTHHANGPKFPPLPDGDFDFEKAQADFKILEEKLNALKLNGAAEDGTPIEIPEVPGIPASAISVAALEQEEVPKEPCYNKTKSFFDSISCEALEREKGANQRVDWKLERKMNRETFGVVSARRPGFYRPGQRGGFGGGGYRGGYHQQRGHHYQGGRGGGHQNSFNRMPRTPNAGGNPNNSTNGIGNNSVSSTTPNNPTRTPKSTPNGVSSSAGPSVAAPIAIATKN